MEDMTMFVYGILIGVVGMAFVVLLMNIRSEFTEIKWHDARWEDPSDYNTSEGIEVLVRFSSGRIDITSYFPEVQSYATMYDCYRNETVTHWAYAVEVGNTIPKRIEPTYNNHHDAI